jgi:hypothetical protein
MIALHSAVADTYTVNTSSDSVIANACANHQANCSLRGAILAANANLGGTIVFGIPIQFCPGSGCVIDLLSALPDITAPMSISGPTQFAIQRSSSAATNFRIFNVATNGTVNFTSLTIAKGSLASGSGAGIQNAGSGTVNITNCTLRNNSAPSDGGAICNKTTGTVNVIDSTISDNGSTFGGGISSSGGQVTVKGSTFSGNTATGPPASGSSMFGGVGRGGAIDVGPGTLVVSNSTFVNNSASGGSGIFGGAGTGGAISYRSNGLQVTNCTLWNNQALAGSGLTGQGTGGGIDNSGTATIKSSIIAGNTATTTADVNGAFTSAGFNLIGQKDGSTGFTAATDLTGTAAAPLDPKLDSNGLKNNGGPTQTIALVVGSPAIDKGSSAGLAGNLTTDQRGSGFPRIFDDATVPNASGGDGADIGAFELQTAQPTPTPTATPSTLANISTRLAVQTGDNVLIGGFIITGTQPKKVILRAIGPSLNLPGQLANPTLELYTGSTLLASNDDWQNQPAADRQAVIDSTIPPSNDLESALVRTLPANNSAYTAIVSGVSNGTGIGVVEAYDLDRTVDSKLANISTRGFVQTGDNVLIAGTIVLGQAPQKVIIRAIGPSLSVPGKLGDPTLELHDGNGATLESNDNWMDSPNKQAIIDSTIPPSDPSESAIVRTLPANGAQYTAILRGVNGTTGIAVVEVYALQ